MNRKLILIVTFVVLAAIAMLTQKRVAHSATSTVPLPPAPAEFTASTDKTFDQLLGDSMNMMHKSIHGARIAAMVSLTWPTRQASRSLRF